MSVHGIIEAMRSDYAPATRIVWQCLENHANGHRVWSSSIDDMAAELHLDRDTVQRAVLKLEKDEIIEIERRRRHASTYHMKRTYPPTGSGKNGSGNGLETEIPTPNGELKTEIPTPTAPLETEKPTPTVHNGHLFESEKPRPTPKLESENTPSSTSTKKESTREVIGAPASASRRSTRTRLPEGWQPDAKGKRYAIGKGVPADQVAAFSNHHTAKGSLMADWDAAWRTWCDRVPQFGRRAEAHRNGWAELIEIEGMDCLRDAGDETGEALMLRIVGHA